MVISGFLISMRSKSLGMLLWRRRWRLGWVFTLGREDGGRLEYGTGDAVRRVLSDRMKRVNHLLEMESTIPLSESDPNKEQPPRAK